ncbi:MAG: thiopurine S-methyltransferase [Pseudomonadota bacterium]
MTDADWHARWRDDRIGFHRSDIHPMLAAHWPTAGVAAGATVFVPLAGKSLDMHWLAAQGHRVVGIELSRVAVEAFFEEAGLEATTGCEAGIDYLEHRNIRLYCGDVFALHTEHLQGVTTCYDRAALVALDAETRRRYAATLAALLPAGSSTLLVTVEYAQLEMSGPPFAVMSDEVERLFAADFAITDLQKTDVLDDEPKFRSRGVTAMRECAWQLVRSDQK